MQVTIFGANGRIGRLTVMEALKRDVRVVAFVHGDNPFVENEKLQVIQGDIYNQNDVAQALNNSDVVISTLGSWSTPNKDILSKGMENIIPAMKSLGINRIVSLTGSGCRTSQDSASLKLFFNRLPLMLVAPKVLNDAEEHIKLLEDSDLDYTIIRSPVMSDEGEAKFRLEEKCPMPWAKINRKSVAIAMLDSLEKTDHLNKAPFISKS
jgi:putative NADH-flavin reductase